MNKFILFLFYFINSLKFCFNSNYLLICNTMEIIINFVANEHSDWDKQIYVESLRNIRGFTSQTNCLHNGSNIATKNQGRFKV